MIAISKSNPLQDTLGTMNTKSNLKRICLTLTRMATKAGAVNSPVMINTGVMINMLDTAQRFSNDASLFVSC